MFTKWVS